MTIDREKLLYLLESMKHRTWTWPDEKIVAILTELENVINSGKLDVIPDAKTCLEIGSELDEIGKWISQNSNFNIACEIRQMKRELERLKNKYEPTPPRVDY